MYSGCGGSGLWLARASDPQPLVQWVHCREGSGALDSSAWFSWLHRTESNVIFTFLELSV
jgi:hypothetical protein